ncbi:MAG TPA: type II toxin-antitoxin system VapC family toxin [Planctomycetaceae bacterium]|nr:type II toxin-antitoxin system VapC family toxin [Planctomycetaceae bacterium]
MKYVLDASVAVKFVLPEHDSAKALALEADFRNQSHELIAPDTFPVEVAHALTKAERRGILLPGEAKMRLSRLLAYPPDLHPYLPLLGRAVEIATQARIGVYDCLYLALCEREQCELVTADQRLISSLATQFPIVSLDSL